MNNAGNLAQRIPKDGIGIPIPKSSVEEFTISREQPSQNLTNRIIPNVVTNDVRSSAYNHLSQNRGSIGENVGLTQSFRSDNPPLPSFVETASLLCGNRGLYKNFGKSALLASDQIRNFAARQDSRSSSAMSSEGTRSELPNANTLQFPTSLRSNTNVGTKTSAGTKATLGFERKLFREVSDHETLNIFSGNYIALRLDRTNRTGRNQDNPALLFSPLYQEGVKREFRLPVKSKTAVSQSNSRSSERNESVAQTKNVQPNGLSYWTDARINSRVQQPTTFQNEDERTLVKHQQYTDFRSQQSRASLRSTERTTSSSPLETIGRITSNTLGYVLGISPAHASEFVQESLTFTI